MIRASRRVRRRALRAVRRRRAWLAWAVLTGAALVLPAFARGATCAGATGVTPERARQVLREHRLRDLAGRPIGLGGPRDEVVVVNLWASWCRPCRRELPELDAFHAEVAGRGGRVVAVSIDLSRDNVERFAKKLGLTLPIAHDGPDGLARQLDVRSIPFTLVVDRGGQIAWTTAGSDAASLAELKTRVRALLAPRPDVTHATEGERP